MHWQKKTSSFRYAGTPVTRTSFSASTPFGVFKVYEAVSGKVFIENPCNNKNIGFMGLIPDPDNEFRMHPRVECENLRDGLNKANETWKQIVAKINSI